MPLSVPMKHCRNLNRTRGRSSRGIWTGRPYAGYLLRENRNDRLLASKFKGYDRSDGDTGAVLLSLASNPLTTTPPLREGVRATAFPVKAPPQYRDGVFLYMFSYSKVIGDGVPRVTGDSTEFFRKDLILCALPRIL